MADASSWQSLLTPAVALVTALVTPILSAFVPRLWQDDLRRLQSESESRIKRLEALEKALSVAATAKAELGIEVTTRDLQTALQEIVREFGGPLVTSRKALEEWARLSIIRRLKVFPNFTEPSDKARQLRWQRNVAFVLVLYLIAYFLISTLLYASDVNDFRQFARNAIDATELSVPKIFLIWFPLYLMVVYYITLIRRFMISRQALKMVRAMSEVRTEPADPPSSAVTAEDLTAGRFIVHNS
jgi:hypothetical protein